MSGYHMARGVCMGILAAVVADGWRMYLLMVALLGAFMLTDWIAEEDVKKRQREFAGKLLRATTRGGRDA